MPLRFFKRWKWPIILLAIWLAFECSFSLLASCQKINYGQPYDSIHQVQCTPFNGPLVTTSVFLFKTLFHLREKYEHELISLFTVVLALSTIALWLSTRSLWQVTRIAAEHIPRVERAYLFGGPNSIVWNSEKRRTYFNIGVDNAGKTPAFLKEIHVVFSQERPTGTAPNYPGGQVVFIDAMINGGANLEKLPVNCEVQWLTEFYVYGFFAYEDIFKERHISRFSTRIVPAIGKFELVGTPAWNNWD